MDKLFTFGLAIAVCLGTTAALANRGRIARLNQHADAYLSNDGAFRDGLYVGRLAAQSGRPLLPPVGRWSTDRDRSSFVVGYQRGYHEGLSASVPTRQN